MNLFIYYFLPSVMRRPPSAVRRPPSAELSLTKLKSKVLTIALRTTKLNCKVEC